MVANALLAPCLQRLLIEGKPGRCNLAQIFFDNILVLRGRRNEGSIENRPIGVYSVAMIKDATRRLGASIANSSTRLVWDKGPRWWLLVGN